MSDDPSPTRQSVEVGAAITSLVQVQAFVAGRLYGELVDVGAITATEAAERLAAMAADIEAMDGPEPFILKAVARPMNDYAAQFREGERPRLQLVASRGEGE